MNETNNRERLRNITFLAVNYSLQVNRLALCSQFIAFTFHSTGLVQQITAR